MEPAGIQVARRLSFTYVRIEDHATTCSEVHLLSPWTNNGHGSFPMNDTEITIIMDMDHFSFPNTKVNDATYWMSSSAIVIT